MNKREFDPEQLRVKGRLAWMKVGDDTHWFSVPSSNDQLVFNEDGVYAHTLTGTALEIMYVSTYEHQSGDNRASVMKWPQLDGFQDPYNNPRVKFSDFVEWGEELYAALADAGVELWSTDPDVLFQWKKSKTILLNEDDNFVVMSRFNLKRIIDNLNSDFERARRERRRAERDRDTQKRSETKRKVEADSAARGRYRATEQYQQLFKELYGKSQAEVDENDFRPAVYWAHCLCEYRLDVGKWAKSAQQQLKKA